MPRKKQLHLRITSLTRIEAPASSERDATYAGPPHKLVRVRTRSKKPCRPDNLLEQRARTEAHRSTAVPGKIRGGKRRRWSARSEPSRDQGEGLMISGDDFSRLDESPDEEVRTLGLVRVRAGKGSHTDEKKNEAAIGESSVSGSAQP